MTSETELEAAARKLRQTGTVFLVDQVGHWWACGVTEYTALPADALEGVAVFFDAQRALACSERRRMRS